MKLTHKKRNVYGQRNFFCVGDPTQPLFHLFTFGVGIGGNANFSVRVGVMQILAFLDTNMFVSPSTNRGVQASARPQRKNFASQWHIGFIVLAEKMVGQLPSRDPFYFISGHFYCVAMYKH